MNTVQENEESPIAKSHASGIINDEILKLEFEGVSSLFENSEDFGEKRTTLMITITGADPV